LPLEREMVADFVPGSVLGADEEGRAPRDAQLAGHGISPVLGRL